MLNVKVKMDVCMNLLSWENTICTSVLDQTDCYYSFKKRLAFNICTWYILSPAKKTQFTRCGKQMK
ncbi:hypothetical protein PAEAM_30860 [Paenibacillus sp. GM1FR]|nr:hypothetical protein PAEAM_30860 [Paenibacillus sp. GM1FR]